MPNRPSSVFTGALLLLLAPADSEAFLRFLHKMSGPGPLVGVHVALRCAVGDTSAAGTRRGTADTAEERPGRRCQPLKRRAPRERMWVTFGYDYLTGDRDSDREDSSRVTWQGPFLGLETTALSRFVGLENRRVGLLLVAEAGLAILSGDAFDRFSRPVMTGGIGLTQRVNRSVSIDYLLHSTYVNVTPEQFRLPPGHFPGGGEWLRGYSLIFSFSR
jgi:hypothetical protein